MVTTRQRKSLCSWRLLIRFVHTERQALLHKTSDCSAIEGDVVSLESFRISLLFWSIGLRENSKDKLVCLNPF